MGCDLCSLQHSVRLARSTFCKSPCFAGTGLFHTSCPDCASVLSPPVAQHVLPHQSHNVGFMQAANRWLNIWVLSESMLG